MKLQIDGRHVEVTDPMKEHINSKLETLDTYIHKDATTHVIVKLEKRRHIVEASVATTHAVFFATAHSEDMYTATDMVVDKLERQMSKSKEKRTSHHEDEVFHHRPVRRAIRR